MGVIRPITDDLTTVFNSTYKINRDVGGWDKMTLQIVAPVLGNGIYLYGTLDSGANNQNTQGNATLAINYTPIQAVNLATGVATNVITGAGLYTVTAANQQFVRLQGNPADTPTNVYRILITNQQQG
jgi:hypothetical protein